MRLGFHGAARQVTGSCFLVDTGRSRVLVDCGAFQGIGEDGEEAFGFEPRSVDVVLLTHAHLDHCGRLPRLVREGFRGEIVATAPTQDLARLVLLDAAALRREERRRGRRRPGGDEMLDTMRTFEHFGRTAVYGRPMKVAKDATATFIDAGHIVGSASVVLEVAEGGGRRRVVFSGDVGNSGRPIVADPTPPPRADVVVMESTYGDRSHRPLAESVEEFYGAAARVLGGGGTVLVPAFALERSQDILWWIRVGLESGRIPRRTRVFLDSPMAISATEIFLTHSAFFEPEARRLLAEGREPFSFEGLRITRTPAASRRIGSARGAIVVAGSGMCTGGRIVGHLARHLPRRECAVVFVSFAAEGTLARRLVDGARSVSIRGRSVHVRASVHTINGFSAHAGRDELLAWHAATGRPERTFLVHGAPDPMDALAQALKAAKHKVATPRRDESFDV